MDDLLSEFLNETSESLSILDAQLATFEQDPSDTEILGNIFRLLHTIKGTCGFLGLPRLESVAHAGENVLGKIRDVDPEVTPEAVPLILKCIDVIRALLGELEETGIEPEGEDSDIINALNAMAEGGGAPADEALAPGGGPATNLFGAPAAAELLAEVMETDAQGVKVATDEVLKAEMAEERQDEAAQVSAEKPASEDAPEPENAKVPAVFADKTPAKIEQEARAPKDASVAARSIRVDVELLENLMTLVSEMVLTRNQLMQMVRGQDDSEFTTPLRRLGLITTDLQKGVMKTRMQLIGNAWAKLPRMVRDLSMESGKKVEFQMLGADTELDRQVLELINDPLTHMVRYSADHGLESPEDRSAVGKPETGKIILNAFLEGGYVVIEITDDGRGLNIDGIKDKVILNGLASEAELEGMSEQQIQQFIFKAGFSTAETVTGVTGRGVGLDVVRTNIEKIGGIIELKSVTGQGSTFTIRIPLTLAIVSALIVECADQRFAIPQISVVELVRVSPHSEYKIEMINESPVLRLRNRLLPLVGLRGLLKLGDGDAGLMARVMAEAPDQQFEPFIVVTQVGTHAFGIIVDRVIDTEEIVVKPVAPILRDIPFYSGNTILGDGSVIMILDPNGIAAATGQGAMSSAPGEAVEESASTQGEETTSLLTFRTGEKELKAVPLALVARLEEIDMTSVEISQGGYVVQYRGHLMPLVPVNPEHVWKTEGRQPILIFTDRNRSMGLVVEEIVDIVEDRLEIEIPAVEDGFVGSAIIDGKATDILDAGYYLTKAFPELFPSASEIAAGEGGSSLRVLLVDDSPFFRNLLTPLLSVAGYDVTTVDNAGAALELRESGARFDAIISDIEMPGMDGFKFAEAVRGDPRWGNVPLVALSSDATEKDFERGRQVGFNDYVVKFDRDALLETMAQTVTSVTAPG